MKKILFYLLLACVSFANAQTNSYYDSHYKKRTFSQCSTLVADHKLKPGKFYCMTDQAQVYDQSGSNVTKTAATEPIVLLATSDSTFAAQVYSLHYPSDYIEYDISVDTTYINAVAAKGKITYRKDDRANEAPFDIRHILMYNTNTTAEQLFFHPDSTNTGNNFPITSDYLAGLGVEFPVSYITGKADQNSNNYLVNTYITGDYTQNTGTKLLVSNITGNYTQNTGAVLIFTNVAGTMQQCSNINLSGCTFGDDVVQMMNITATDCEITGSSDYCTTGSWNNTYFGEQVNKAIGTNYNNDSIIGRIDRNINCAITRSYFGGETLGLYWCEGLFTSDCRFEGNFQGVNFMSIDSTTSDCNTANITGMGHNSSLYGFHKCTIDGTSSGSTFGNITVTCKVDTRTMDEASYPELFDTSIHKTIYEQPDGDIFYWYLDDTNTIVPVEITP